MHLFHVSLLGSEACHSLPTLTKLQYSYHPVSCQLVS